MKKTIIILLLFVVVFAGLWLVEEGGIGEQDKYEEHPNVERHIVDLAYVADAVEVASNKGLLAGDLKEFSKAKPIIFQDDMINAVVYLEDIDTPFPKEYDYTPEGYDYILKSCRYGEVVEVWAFPDQLLELSKEAGIKSISLPSPQRSGFTLPDGLYVCFNGRDNLPVPEFKVCPYNNSDCTPEGESVLEFFVEDVPLTSVALFIQTETDGLNLVENTGNTIGKIHPSVYKIVGTNKIKVYTDVAARVGGVDVLIKPNENLKVNVKIFESGDEKGEVIFYRPENLASFPNNAVEYKESADRVTQRIDSLTGQLHVRYKIYYLPSFMAMFFGSEGDFYLGNGKIRINQGTLTDGPEKGSTKNLTSSQYNFEKEVAHEYGHAIQSDIYDYAALGEGLTDAMAVYLGYREEKVLLNPGGIGGETYTTVCSEFSRPHNLGRCIFGHLYKRNLFSDEFFKNIFNPTRDYNFVSQESKELKDMHVCDAYNVLLSESTGVDLTEVFIDDMGGTCSPALEEARENLDNKPQETRPRRSR